MLMAVLDASFIVKLVLREPRSEEALKAFKRIIASREPIRAPCIAIAEVLNAVWKHVTLIKDLPRDRVPDVLKCLASLWRVVNVHKHDELAEKALSIALDLSITVYDAYYITLAHRYGEPLFTFDTRLAEKAREIGLEVVIP